MNLVTVRGQRNGKRYGKRYRKGTRQRNGKGMQRAKGQKGKRYGKSMNKGLIKKHAVKAASEESAPRLNVATA